MGRSSGLGGVIKGITGEGGTLTGRGRGIPMPMFPTENVGIMSSSMRKKGRVTRRDERGSRRGARGGMMQVTMRDPKTGQMYGGLVKDGVPQFKAPDGSTPQGYPAIRADGKGIKEPPPGMKYDEADRLVPKELDSKARREVEITRRRLEDQPGFDPSKPSAVMETERVNVQDPTLGGPPEREVPMPKERDTSPRGPAPFSPDERAMARDAFFEKMFSRADERKQSRAMDQEERRNVMDARRDEATMRGSERGMRDERGGRRRRGMRNERGGRRRMRRRDFTRRRSQMEGRRSREERAAFRDRFVSTLR